MDFANFKMLWQRAYNHGLKLFRTLKSTDAEEEAEDHASEVVYRFWRTCKNKNISIQDQPLTLFYTISKNRFKDWLRTRKRNLDKMDKYQRERETDTETHDPNNEISQILNNAMGQLSDRESQVISLTRIGKTESEIVEDTGLTTNQVKYAKRTAFKILKQDPALAEYMES